MNTRDTLIEYYNKTSKHSNYQVLPRALQALLSSEDVDTKTRSEYARLDYILGQVNVVGKSVMDIGGNTGFFTFELLDAGAKSVHYYEGNKEHAEFVKLGAEALGVSDKLRITNSYFTFDGNPEFSYDVVLLLNVLHHLGDDYGDQTLSIEAAKEGIITQLNSMATQAKTLVFQMGFNWHGNPATCLFENGTKQEMVDYIKAGVDGVWDITTIGIAEKTDKGVQYAAMNDKNIERDDTMGEFLNRPLFILQSKKV